MGEQHLQAFLLRQGTNKAKKINKTKSPQEPQPLTELQLKSHS